MPDAAQIPVLRIENLHFSIGELKILNGISFEVPAGQRLGIIGPNGSGKTTLFNCLNGFNKPSTGSIHFCGRDITRLPAHRRAGLGMARVFQHFGVFREMTVLENLITAIESKQGASFLPWNRNTKKNNLAALEYLEMVDLADAAREKAGSLSGGQMRLLEIVRAIAFGAELFLLDEPTAGVSPKMKNEVENVLKKLETLKKTIMIIEHDANFIQKICDRVIVLDVGQVLLDDTPEQIRANPMLQEIYFGSQNGTA